MTKGILADLGVEIIKLVCSLQSAPPTDAELLRQRCDALLADFTAKALHAGYPTDLVEQAKYAFVALIDERVLSLRGPISEVWLNNPLQMRHFESFAAGDEFYSRLAQYRHPNQPARADVLEVFHLCLALGFKGRYSDDRGNTQRRLLMDQIAAEVLGAYGGNLAELSPAWKPTGAPSSLPNPWRWLGLPVWLVPVILMLVLGLLWLVGNAWINQTVERFVHDFPLR